MRRIAIMGTGGVKLSSAMLLAVRDEVLALDIDEYKVQPLNQKNHRHWTTK